MKSGTIFDIENPEHNEDDTKDISKYALALIRDEITAPNPDLTLTKQGKNWCPAGRPPR